MTVRRPAGWADTGEPLPAEEHTVEGCGWAPRSSTELGDLRETVVVGLTLYAPHGSDIRSSDQVVISNYLGDGGAPVVWEVDGEIGNFGSPFSGWRAGLRVALKRAKG